MGNQKRNKKTGKVTYYLQTVGAAVVSPDHKEVIVLPPETIKKQDGETKMDCERNAVRRFLGKLRQDHPHLQFIVNEDGLSSNGPHIEDLEAYNLHYILGVKPGDHKFLFQYVDTAEANGDVTELAITKPDKPYLTHCFRIVYNAPLNKTHQQKKVTFVEYWEENSKTDKTQHFTWITDLTINEDNVFHFMRGARARWKIDYADIQNMQSVERRRLFQHAYRKGLWVCRQDGQLRILLWVGGSHSDSPISPSIGRDPHVGTLFSKDRTEGGAA